MNRPLGPCNVADDRNVTFQDTLWRRRVGLCPKTLVWFAIDGLRTEQEVSDVGVFCG